MIISLVTVIALGIVAWFCGQLPQPQYFMGVILPLAAVTIFLSGFVWRIFDWAKSPVPFAIPTVAGQQDSLDFIKPARLDSPFTKTATFGRVLLEILLFRSLFRNTKAQIKDGKHLVYWSSKWLWVFSLAFHYSILVIFFRHFRFFLDPVPLSIAATEAVDGLMQVGVPRFYITDALVFAALLFLLCRRLMDKKLRYISLPSDYFSLFLLIGLTGSGICMRYMDKADINTIKTFVMGLVTFSPVAATGIAPLFFVHIVFFSVLLIYFPFSKLMHMGGIFLSPTRNLPNNTRAVRHNNPWNPPKEYRTYAEYENDFRDVMAEAELPLEITPEEAAAIGTLKE